MKKIKLNQTPKCFITYLCFQPFRDCITKIWIIKDIWVLLCRRGKKTIAHALFHLEEMLLSLESLWQGSLMCLRCETREIHRVSLYRATSDATTLPPTLNFLHFMTAAVEFISSSLNFWNITFRIFHWLQIVAEIRFKTWLRFSAQIVEQLLVYARLDHYRALPSLSDIHISHFWGSGGMMLPCLHQEVYSFWPKPVVETLHRKLITTKSPLILLQSHKTLGHPTNQCRKCKKERKKVCLYSANVFTNKKRKYKKIRI